MTTENKSCANYNKYSEVCGICNCNNSERDCWEAHEHLITPPPSELVERMTPCIACNGMMTNKEQRERCSKCTIIIDYIHTQGYVKTEAKKPTELPEFGKPVLAIVQHFYTKGKRFAVLKSVKEDDNCWRTVDDNSELANEWNVIEWGYLPELANSIRLKDKTKEKE